MSDDNSTYRQFSNLNDANTYAQQQTDLMNLPAGGITTAWALPIELQDGSYIVQAYQDNTAVPWQKSWMMQQQTMYS